MILLQAAALLLLLRFCRQQCWQYCYAASSSNKHLLQCVHVKVTHDHPFTNMSTCFKLLLWFTALLAKGGNVIHLSGVDLGFCEGG